MSDANLPFDPLDALREAVDMFNAIVIAFGDAFDRATALMTPDTEEEHEIDGDTE